MAIFILTPTLGHPTVGYVNSVLRTTSELRAAKVPHALKMVAGVSPIQLARAECARLFLELKPATHLLFVDDDMVFTEFDVLALRGADKPIVGALCTSKTDRVTSYNTLPRASPEVDVDLVEVDGVGAGFMMIRRDVVEAVAAATPDLEISPGLSRKMMFECGSHNGKYLSEDYAFCRRARDLGFSSWAHAGLDVGHEGSKVYRGKHTPAQKISLLTSSYDG